MAHSIQRLTMFALLSALEIDLREFIQLYLVPAVGKSSLLSAEMRGKAVERFQRDNSNDKNPAIDDIIQYLDLGDELQLIRSREATLDDLTKTYFRKYHLGLEFHSFLFVTA